MRAAASTSVTTTLVTGLALFLLLPAAAPAQQAPAPGMLTTRAFEKLPEAPTVAVAPYDDSTLNLKLKQDFEAQLADQGLATVAAEPTAGYLLLFESEVIPADRAPHRPNLGSARASGGLGPNPTDPSKSADAQVDVNVNVWSSTKDSILGGRRDEQAIGSSVFHINAVLRDRRSGEVVWQGDAYYVLLKPEPEAVARAMVAPLIEKMGQSVVREPFEIR